MANMTTQEILQGIKDWAAPKVTYDISAAHNNTKYTDLADALGTNGGNIPQEYRKGGITVRFVCTYDNKYVQFRLMSDTFNITVANWQGVDDEPTIGSDNLVKSGGVLRMISPLMLLQNSIKDFVIEGKCYAPAGQIYISPDYSMLDYIDVNGSNYVYYYGITNASCRCYSDNGFIGSATQDTTNHRFVLIEGTKKVGICWNNTNYQNYDNCYFIFSSVFKEIYDTFSELKAFDSSIPLTYINRLVSGIIPVDSIFIDNSYYNNADGVPASADTYARTSKIPVGDKTFCYTFGFNTNDVFCWNENTFLGRVSLNNNIERKFVFLENTTHIAFNFQKARQPEDYKDNGIIFNMLSFVPNFSKEIDDLKTFDSSVPITKIHKFFNNAFNIKDYFYDNHYYYNGSVLNADTYACTTKIPVSCSSIFILGFKKDSPFCWDNSNTYLGRGDEDEFGRFIFPENTAYIAFNFQKSAQPEGYYENGLAYNFEPFVLDNLIDTDKTRRLVSGIIPLDSVFIDNSYYYNGSVLNADTYARTSKIPVGDKTFCYIFGFNTNDVFCWNENTFLGRVSLNNNIERKFVFLENTTHIAFNFQKARQPEDYKDNGIIFNMLSFVPNFSKEIKDLKTAIDGKLSTDANILYGKKWCVVGDSFSEWSPEIFSDGEYSGKRKTYKYFIALRNNMVISDYTLSGRTMAYPNDHTFNNAFAKPSLYQSIPVDADYITIQLGINDVSHVLGESQDAESVDGDITIGTIDSTDTGTFYGAWNVVLQWIFENRPNAHVGIIITNGLGQNGPTGTYSAVGMQIYTALKDIVRKWNVPYIDLNGGDGKTPMMQRGIYPEGTPAALITAKWNAFATSPTSPYNGHTNVAGHLYESTFIESFLRSL